MIGIPVGSTLVKFNLGALLHSIGERLPNEWIPDSSPLLFSRLFCLETSKVRECGGGLPSWDGGSLHSGCDCLVLVGGATVAVIVLAFGAIGAISAVAVGGVVAVAGRIFHVCGFLRPLGFCNERRHGGVGLWTDEGSN
ncbi:hypothetical protein DSO57_1004508 [Entomophthora muscae]|uniref:Uncharacterized protein n=1 Tax=Entomophthora muscae TaxID=34485 RepID=A0ACC2RMZ0_9FUNG|nr:hypothetical protein DSO57_1004508 [Entomophthora muscae]